MLASITIPDFWAGVAVGAVAVVALAYVISFFSGD
jgi:hypothetical protein